MSTRKFSYMGTRWKYSHYCTHSVGGYREPCVLRRCCIFWLKNNTFSSHFLCTSTLLSVPTKSVNGCHYNSKVSDKLKPNSWTYNFVEVSGHNLESLRTWGFRIQCFHDKPVSTHFSSKGGGVKSISRGDRGKLKRLLSQLRSRIRPLAQLYECT